MRFFRGSVWASRSVSLLVWFLAVGGVYGGEPPSFTLDPSTVTAGRTLTVLCETTTSLRNARAQFGKTQTRFYKESPTQWRARLGIDAMEKPGSHTLLLTGASGGRRFTIDVPLRVRAGSYPVSIINLKPEKDSLYTSGAVAADGKRLASFYTKIGSSKKEWDGAFVQPSTGVVSSVFGARRSYGERPPSSAHSGVDLANAEGTVIQAPASGRVVLSEWMESFGHVVMLDHGQGIYSYYLHMKSRAVDVGQRVKQGHLLGLMGQEGVATGPHLHWSLSVAGVRVDPMEWVKRAIP
jgi:murein DD-endopeptidase MepM/ murein hydrolase activator NlpD